MSVNLYQGDCLSVMKRLPAESVDLILADLPYGTTQNKWDSVIPLDLLWLEYWRIAKSNAAVVLTAAQPFTSVLVMSQLAAFRYDWTWRKPRGTGHLNAKKQPMRDKEDVLVFCQTTPAYKPQFTVGTPFGNKRGENSSAYNSHGAVNYINATGKRYPKQVLEFEVEERGLHRTQKPVALMKYMVLTYTNRGDVVLDNTMGSGTTGVACVETGRHFIGIEKNPAYFQLARSRIAESDFG